MCVWLWIVWHISQLTQFSTPTKFNNQTSYRFGAQLSKFSIGVFEIFTIYMPDELKGQNIRINKKFWFKCEAWGAKSPSNVHSKSLTWSQMGSFARYTILSIL